MAEGPAPRINLEDIFNILDDEGPACSRPGGIDQREVKDFFDKMEQYRQQELRDKEEKAARMPQEHRDILRKAHASKKALEELQDIMVRDKKRIFRKYTEKDLIKKIISLGPYGRDPEVLKLFDTDEKGNMSFENMKKISDMLGPYAYRLDIDVPNFTERVYPFEHLFCIPDIIDRVCESITELERSFNAA